MGVLQRAQRARGHGPADGPDGAPTHEIERQGRWKQAAAWSATTPRGESARFGPALPLGGEVSATRRRMRSSAGFRTPEGASTITSFILGNSCPAKAPPNPSPSGAPLGHPTSGNRPYSRCFPLHAGASRWDDPAGDKLVTLASTLFLLGRTTAAARTAAPYH